MGRAKAKPSRSSSERGHTRRVDKVEATRQSLFDAALKVVGESGYAGSSIAKIAARANVAQGTFYSYFDSQQDVFNQLLPFLGDRLLNQIRGKLKGCTDPYEREEIGFRAYFEFLSENPEFERILSEASVFTPQGFKDHVENIVSGYMRAFHHSKAKGLLAHYSERELEAVTYILLGARAYLSFRFMANGNGRIDSRKLPEWALTAYMKFMRYGLTGPRRARLRGLEMDPTEILDRPKTNRLTVLKAGEGESVVSAEYEPAEEELATLLSRMAVKAARTTAPKMQLSSVTHFAWSMLSLEPSRSGLVYAKARLTDCEDSPFPVFINFSTQKSGEGPFASGQLFLSRLG